MGGGMSSCVDPFITHDRNSIKFSSGRMRSISWWIPYATETTCVSRHPPNRIVPSPRFETLTHAIFSSFASILNQWLACVSAPHIDIESPPLESISGPTPFFFLLPFVRNPISSLCSDYQKSSYIYTRITVHWSTNPHHHIQRDCITTSIIFNGDPLWIAQ